MQAEKAVVLRRRKGERGDRPLPDLTYLGALRIRCYCANSSLAYSCGWLRWQHYNFSPRVERAKTVRKLWWRRRSPRRPSLSAKCSTNALFATESAPQKVSLARNITTGLGGMTTSVPSPGEVTLTAQLPRDADSTDGLIGGLSLPVLIPQRVQVSRSPPLNPKRLHPAITCSLFSLL
jgi:hypothetical protein